MRLTPPPLPPGALVLLSLLLGAVAQAVAPSAAAAAALDPYRVAGIPVDATAENAVAARDLALETGQREGLRQLLRRLTLPDDHDRLPDAGGLPAERYVQSLEIASEKVAPTRYVATLNVAYAPEPVRGLLREAGVAFLERRPEPVLAVPALAAVEDGLDLWGEDNPWRAAWNAGVAGGLVEVRLPLGDALDVSTVAPDALRAGDSAGLQALAQRYGAQLAVLALARPRDGGGPGAGPRALELEVRPADAPEQPFLRETLTARPGEDELALYRRAVERAVAGIELGLKRRLIVRAEDLAELEVRVPLVDLSSWVQIRQALAALPEVRSVRVDSFARSEAVVSLSHAGGPEDLAAAARRAGLSLVEEDGAWLLRQAGGPGAFQAPLSASPASP